jgi:hypothetical protein
MNIYETYFHEGLKQAYDKINNEILKTYNKILEKHGIEPSGELDLQILVENNIITNNELFTIQILISIIDTEFLKLMANETNYNEERIPHSLYRENAIIILGNIETLLSRIKKILEAKTQ